jgi:hypothetical protein
MSPNTGSATIDIWKCPYSQFPPTSSNSITGQAGPILISGLIYQNSSLTGWNNIITGGDIMRFMVVSTGISNIGCSGITISLVANKL